MPRYIDADALYQEIDDLREGFADIYGKNDEFYSCLERTLDIIDVAPTVDVVERKKGKWIKEPNCWYRCSQCRSHYPSFKDAMDYNYCPNCGCAMEGAAMEGAKEQ